MEGERILYCRTPKPKRPPAPFAIKGEAEITYHDDTVKKIQFVAVELGDEAVTFTMADGSTWPIQRTEVRNIFIPA